MQTLLDFLPPSKQALTLLPKPNKQQSIKKAYVGIVGYYGNDVQLMTYSVFQRLLYEVSRCIQSVFHLKPEDTTLVGNGGTWSNHVPVALLLDPKHGFNHARLYLATAVPYAKTNPLYGSHQLMSKRMMLGGAPRPYSSLADITRALQQPHCTHKTCKGFPDRNKAFEKELTHLIFISGGLHRDNDPRFGWQHAIGLPKENVHRIALKDLLPVAQSEKKRKRET